MKRRGGVEPSTRSRNGVNEQTTIAKDDDKKQRRRNARKQLDGSMKCLHTSLCLIVLAYVLFFAEEHQLDLEEQVSDLRENTGGDNTLATAAVATIKRPYRFPKYGTDEFDQQCPWATVQGSEAKNCTVYFRPAKTTEGLSSWVNIVAQTFLIARQAGCQIKFDYGEHVNIYETISPFPHNHAHNNWTVPTGFECSFETNCYTFQQRAKIAKAVGLNYKLQPVPIYRHVYSPLGRSHYTRDTFNGLQKTLFQFKLETGMACALGGLFNLSPSLSKYEPDLFTTLLPKLHDEETLVMTLYIRTGNTDLMATQEAKDGKVDYHSEGLSGNYMPHSKCALHLEQEYLAGRIRINNHTSPSISRVVWLVVTDSPKTKNRLATAFNGKTIVTDHQQTITRNITREVIGSRSLGIHSRNTRNVSKSDFADSFLDWYLIGESDVVIDKVGAYTYGETGALRTARPVYDAKNDPCSKVFFVKDDIQD